MAMMRPDMFRLASRAGDMGQHRASPLQLFAVGVALHTRGKLILVGAVSFADSAFDIEIVGTVSSKFDVLEVVRRATLSGGIRRLRFINEFLPHADDQRGLLNFSGSINGLDQLSFEVGGLPTGYTFLPTGYTFTLRYTRAALKPAWRGGGGSPDRKRHDDAIRCRFLTNAQGKPYSAEVVG